MSFSERYVIITAGGRGKRMGGDYPKQLLDLGGEPILRRTIELFLDLPFKVNIIIVINHEIKELWKQYCLKHDFLFKHILVSGGITRFHSVKKGMKYLTPGSIVAVHDGVRPLVSKEMIISLFEQAEEHQAVIPVTQVAESMREKREDGSIQVVDRERFMMVQTPQVFKSDILIDSYKQAYSPLFTDDASVVENKGYELYFCNGSRLNIKITTPEDLLFVRSVFGREIIDPDLSFNSLV